MHVPDGFLNLPTSAATAVAAVSVVALSARRARAELDDRTAPLAGLVATFVFAAQMINFPVGAGTSGHLIGAALGGPAVWAIGAALAAALVGPWVATLCLTVVLIVQTLLFADGGVSALGTNVLLMGIVAVWTAWWVMQTVIRLTRGRPRGVLIAVALGSLISVPVAALAFSVLFAVGGAAEVPVGLLMKTMAGWHVLIGAGEALATTAIVGAVLRPRPDLVRVARRPAEDVTSQESVVIA